MKYKVDKSNRPVYLQIYKQIKDDIINGNYQFNTKLPSKRLLADETETSTVTIEHAYALLCDEGYVESRERSGYFVIFRNTDGFALSSTSEQKGSELPYKHNTSPDFPFSVLAKTMRSVISDFGECTAGEFLLKIIHSYVDSVMDFFIAVYFRTKVFDLYFFYITAASCQAQHKNKR